MRAPPDAVSADGRTARPAGEVVQSTPATSGTAPVVEGDHQVEALAGGDLQDIDGDRLDGEAVGVGTVIR